AVKNSFLSLWFKNPPNLQIGIYSGSGVGLSTGGDEVNLYDGNGAKRAGVIFGANTGAAGVFRSFDNTAGLDNTTIPTLSRPGVNGAFAIPDVNPGPPPVAVTAIGSPGVLGAAATAVVTIAATDANAAETAGNPGTFRITRTGSTTGVLTVNYTIAAGAGQAS